jgi:hypothetical protein
LNDPVRLLFVTGDQQGKTLAVPETDRAVLSCDDALQQLKIGG